MTTATDHPQATSTELPILLGLREMAEIFPVAPQTVYRWRVRRQGSNGQALPAPLVEISGTPIWDEQTVLAFGEGRGLKPDAKVLARIRREQRRNSP